jgi:serine/threonine protein kinase
MSAVSIPLIILGFLAAAVALALLIFLFTALFGLTWRILRNVFRFIGAEVTDALRLVGAVITALLFGPLVVLNIVIGRWSASRHFAAAFWSEVSSAGSAVYRLAVGNPARLFGMGTALEGVERRVPQAMAAAPGRDKPARRVGQFDGYTIVGSLQGGGSGSKLYIAEPDAIKRAGFARQGIGDVDRVVIKVFSLKDGSSLPQIVRESRALDAAKKLGLVLEHDLGSERFFYVMRYVPGDSLSVVTQRMHAESASEGLDTRRLGTVLGYACDLLASLETYHRAGLWHKDVKPDNIIIDGTDGRAHLVDFGLVTPLRSSMTLTTHGTEYFRDPELVRQALRGVKVHQIDGSKFDIYAAGAVMYSVIENSFPAHGGLSQIGKRCPEALRWVVRRAMTDYDRRYATAGEMLADLRVIQNAADPFRLKPVDLPSVSGRAGDYEPEPEPEAFDPMVGGARRSPTPPPAPVAPEPPAEPAAPAGRPRLSVSDWWTGRYSVMGAPAKPAARVAARRPVARPAPAQRNLVPADARKSAKDQVRDARARVRQRRNAASQRIAGRRAGRRPAPYTNSPGPGVVFAGLLGLAVLAAGAVVIGGLITAKVERERNAVVVTGADDDFGIRIGDPENPFFFTDGAQATVHAAPAPPAPSAVPAPTPAALSEVHATILVVSDLTLPLAETTADAVGRGLSTINASGAELVGDLIDEDGDGSIELVAGLRRDRGSVPFDSDDLPVRARAWLDGRPVDGVLFIAPGATASDPPQSLLVTRKFFTRLGWDRAPAQFVRILAGNGYVPD